MANLIRMKKTNTIVLALVVVMASSCSLLGLSVPGKKEKKFVEKFLTEMMDHDQNVLRKYISPKYLEEAKPPSDWKVNTFYHESLEVLSYDEESSHVVALIYGEDKGWTHRLTFKIVREGGKMYLWSEDHDFTYDYVDPWILAEQWINK